MKAEVLSYAVLVLSLSLLLLGWRVVEDIVGVVVKEGVSSILYEASVAVLVVVAGVVVERSVVVVSVLDSCGTLIPVRVL